MLTIWAFCPKKTLVASQRTPMRPLAVSFASLVPIVQSPLQCLYALGLAPHLCTGQVVAPALASLNQVRAGAALLGLVRLMIVLGLCSNVFLLTSSLMLPMQLAGL